MEKLYFSDLADNETWKRSVHFSYLIVPSKWWSIGAWREAREFSKGIRLMFMKIK